MSVRIRPVPVFALAGVAAAAGLAVLASFAAPPGPAPPASAGPAGSTVATVGTLRVESSELESAVREALDLYRQRTQSDMDPQLEPLVRRQVLENLIRQRLLSLEAARRGMTVSDADADAELRRDPAFEKGGVFNEARYLAIKATNPEAYRRSLAAIKTSLAARRAGQQMEREVRPDEGELRGRLERELAHAAYSYLALRDADFDPDLPEPRESEVIAYWSAHPDSFPRPAQANVSIIPVNRPAMPESAGASDAGFRAWEQLIRARADSARAAIRAGARFEAIASLYGGARRNVVLRRDQLPQFWRGDARDVAAALAAAPGTVLEPVPATSGWMLVRVESVVPAHVASLEEVSPQIRRRLREAARHRIEDVDLRRIYSAHADSLRGPGHAIRYAIADTGSFAPGEPTAQDLERYYRSHIADYSSFDRATSQIAAAPLERVREDVRSRWAHERSVDLARAAAERVRDLWSRGRRDPAIEKAMTVVRDPGVVLASSPVGEGASAEALEESISRRAGQPGTWMIAAPGGFVVCQMGETVPAYVPTFEQARALLEPQRQLTLDARNERAARILFDRDSTTYLAPRTIQFTRAVVAPPRLFDVPLTRAEVERYYRAHLNDYSVEELVHVRHILISPKGHGPAAAAAARILAEDVLRRVKAGEDFAKLAAQYSDDPATKDESGDVGMFRHGQMREAFERAAFAMRAGDITGPVKTEVGYHVLECLEYVPPVIHPLAEVYANVSHDAALAKSNRMAIERADSLARTLKTRAQALDLGRRLGLQMIPSTHQIGSRSSYPAELQTYVRKLETLQPGQVYPGSQYYEGLGPVITWVDAIDPTRNLAWEAARPLAVQRLLQQRKRDMIEAKRAELDSLAAAGWSFDRLGTLWGGLERVPEAQPGGLLRGLGGRALLDSLVFGLSQPAVLAPGTVSDWIAFPGGLVKLRVDDRMPADPDELARRIEVRRQIALWRRLNDYFDRLKARYPVRILDAELRATELPEPQDES